MSQGNGPGQVGVEAASTGVPPGCEDAPSGGASCRSATGGRRHPRVGGARDLVAHLLDREVGPGAAERSHPPEQPRRLVARDEQGEDVVLADREAMPGQHGPQSREVGVKTNADGVVDAHVAIPPLRGAAPAAGPRPLSLPAIAPRQTGGRKPRRRAGQVAAGGSAARGPGGSRNPNPARAEVSNGRSQNVPETGRFRACSVQPCPSMTTPATLKRSRTTKLGTRPRPFSAS